MNPMTETEKNLVIDNLHLVKNLVLYHSGYQKGTVGLEYEDLYQTGCIALCKAATSYHAGGGASFETYATRVIRNKLRDHRRHFGYIQSRLCYLDAPVSHTDEDGTYLELILGFGEPASYNEADLLDILGRAKDSYTGITRKGIEAIELKCKGYSNTEIANIYKVKSNHIAAWISRARNRLKTDERLTDLLCS